MNTEPTMYHIRNRSHGPNADEPMNDARGKLRRLVRMAGGGPRWRNAQVIKVHFAVEPSTEIPIGERVSSPGNESQSYDY